MSDHKNLIGELRMSGNRLMQRAADALEEAEKRTPGEPSDEQVERAWQSILATAVDVTTRGDVRAALTAAGVAPQPGIDEAALAVVTDAAIAEYFEQPNDDSREPLRVLIACAVATWLKGGMR